MPIAIQIEKVHFALGTGETIAGLGGIASASQYPEIARIPIMLLGTIMFFRGLWHFYKFNP